MIKLDINIGDIILVGRFKNKRIEVKEFGIDEHGLPTINGRSILKIRIEKLMKTKKNLKEGKWNHDAVGRSGPISVYRDGTKSVKFYMENDKWMYSVTKPNGDQAPGFSFGKSTGTVDAQYSKYFDNGNIRGMTVAAKKILKEGMIHESKQFNLMNIVKKILNEVVRSFAVSTPENKFTGDTKSIKKQADEFLTFLKNEKYTWSSQNYFLYFPDFKWNGGKQSYGPSIGILIGSDTIIIRFLQSGKTFKVGDGLLQKLISGGAIESYSMKYDTSSMT